MSVLVDTSAVYALLDRDDANHTAAARAFEDLIEHEELVTHNYVVLESAALVHRRLGPRAARALLEDLLPAFRLLWVDRDVHVAAQSAFLAAIRRRVSLVDWTSFELIRRLGFEAAFAFDRDFEHQGFRTIP